MNWQEEYKSKLMTANEAVKLIKDGDKIVTSFGCGEPRGIERAMFENYADFSTITGCIFPKPRISVENSVESVENPIFWGGFFHTRFHENCRSITFC